METPTPALGAGSGGHLAGATNKVEGAVQWERALVGHPSDPKEEVVTRCAYNGAFHMLPHP